MKRPTFHALDWAIVIALVGGVIVELYRYYTHQGVDTVPSIPLILTAVF
jgi:hypothetical protein